MDVRSTFETQTALRRKAQAIRREHQPFFRLPGVEQNDKRNNEANRAMVQPWDPNHLCLYSKITESNFTNSWTLALICRVLTNQSEVLPVAGWAIKLEISKLNEIALARGSFTYGK